MHHKYGWFAVIVVALVSIISVLSGCSRVAFRESKEEIFSNDYDLLALVSDYLVELEHERVYITSTFLDGEISVDGSTYWIDDEGIVHAIMLLEESGCTVIRKYDGIVTFLYWSTLDASKGFAYSSNGINPQVDFQTHLEKLSMDNWFYYEANYNMWKLENQKSK